MKGGNMNNKGLSNIIATVLIVLLALAAVAIVWTVMNGLIGDTSGQIELTNLCVLSEAKPISCDTLTTDTDISVQLVRGENVLSTDAKAGVREVVAVVTFKDGITFLSEHQSGKAMDIYLWNK